jgi:hypothetical protein
MEPNDLLEKLRTTANEFLNADGIFPVLDYAWEGEDTPSSEYTGLAMWTTDAPFELDHNFWHRTVPPPEPTQQDEIFHKAAEDFIGTMELARNSIGLTRYSWEHRKPDYVLDDEEMFWEHRATAVLWLNIASDRIRDYFVMARFGITAKAYKKLHEDNGIYARPFRTHQASEGEFARKVAVEVMPLAEQLGSFRRTRNEIVHGTASRRGRNALISLNNQREEAKQTPFVPRTMTAEAFDLRVRADVIKAIEDGKQKELRDALQELREWYLLLVRSSSMVFEFEYWKRISR